MIQIENVLKMMFFSLVYLMIDIDFKMTEVLLGYCVFTHSMAKSK